jgi:hypothetical protein
MWVKRKIPVGPFANYNQPISSHAQLNEDWELSQKPIPLELSNA